MRKTHFDLMAAFWLLTKQQVYWLLA